jgi:hypothetical protein
MSQIDSKDRIPLIAAIVVMALGNAIGYIANVTIYLTIIAAPVAIATFGILRYMMHGSPVPMDVDLY